MSRYEIHSAVFIFKARVAGAISSDNHERLVEMMRRFVSSLDRATTGDKHIASRYSKLLQKLWFEEPAPKTTNEPHASQRDILGVQVTPITPPLGLGADPLAMTDHIGLQYFDFTDSADGLFSMPLISSMDQSGGF